MTNLEDILGPAAYRNYRNVRAASMLFVLLGGILVLGGIGLAVMEPSNRIERVPPAVAVGIAGLGLAGVVGGIAALSGSRRWAVLSYGMAALYIFSFPIGTILSLVLLTGLSRYLDSLERVRAATLPITRSGAGEP